MDRYSQPTPGLGTGGRRFRRFVYSGFDVSRDFPEVNGLGLDPGRANVFRSDDGGETWITDNRDLGGNSSFFFGSRREESLCSFVVFASDGDRVYRKKGPNVPWTRLEGIAGGPFGIADLAVYPNDPNRLYGLSSDRLFLPWTAAGLGITTLTSTAGGRP